MFTVYKAQTAHFAAEKVISEIGGTGRHIVIAPDAFTLAVEKTISAKLGKKGFFDIEVMSFARLASVFLGDDIDRCLSPAGSVMLMEKVIRREKENLRHYRRAAGMPGFSAEMYAAITSIRNSGVSPDALRSIGDTMKGYVGEKTADIARLYGEYLSELERSHTDSTTRLEALATRIRESEEIGDLSFYIVDHIDLNAKQIDVVSAMMARARNVLVAVPDGAGALNERIYPSLLEKLRYAAKRENVSLREIFVPSPLPEEKQAIADELFAYSFGQRHSENLRLWEAKDIEEEVTLLATEITSLIRREGRRYGDIAVITPSFEEYLPQVERIFRLYDIPFFADRRSPLSESDLFRHILLAMEIPIRGYDRTVVCKYILHRLFDASVEEKEAFIDYIDKSGADKGRFREKFTLFEEDPRYASAEKLRADLIREIAPFAACPHRATVAEYAESLRAYLSMNGYDEKVRIYLDAIVAMGLPEKAEILRQVPAAMMTLLDELVELRGEEEIEYADFIIALRSGAAQVKIASLPVSLDCVYFAPVKQAMYAPIYALFVMGAEDGLFPLEQVGEGILGAVEYEAWQNRGITIENTGIEELSQSRFHAVQLLLRGERTYLSHVESTPSSPCFRQLAEIFEISAEKASEVMEGYDSGILIPTRQVAERAIIEYSRRAHESLLTERERAIASAVAEILGESFPLPIRTDDPRRLSSGEIYFRKGTTSVSELESYFKCPFLHFVQYGLNAREKEKVSFDKLDVGNVVHECMQRFVEKMRRTGYDITDAKARKMAREIAEKILSEPKYEAVRRQEGDRAIARAIRCCGEVAVTVKEQILHSSFKPALFEKSFPERSYEVFSKSDTEELPSLSTVRIGGVSLTGRIDRVDVLEEEKERFAVAFDYKTGNAKISSSDLYIGKKIQLPLYLSVLENSGFSPVAALYYSLSDNRTEGEQLLYGPKLVAMNDSLGDGRGNIVNRLDRAISDQPSPYTGISKGEDGYTEKEGMILDEGAFRAQMDYALEVSSGAVREIKEGYIRPSAIKTGMNAHCAYCAAKNICRHKEERIRSSESVSAEDIYSIIEKRKEDEKRGEENAD